MFFFKFGGFLYWPVLVSSLRPKEVSPETTIGDLYLTQLQVTPMQESPPILSPP